MKVFFYKSDDEIIKKELEKILDSDYGEISIPKALKVRKGRSIYGEMYYYTDTNCFKERFRWKYNNMKYSKKLFDNITEFEYELNEMIFEGNNKVNKMISTIKVLLKQFEELDDNIILFINSNSVSTNGDYEVEYSLSFIKVRSNKKTILQLCERESIVMIIKNIEEI